MQFKKKKNEILLTKSHFLPYHIFKMLWAKIVFVSKSNIVVNKSLPKTANV